MKAADGSPKNIDDYITGFPRDVQGILQDLRQSIADAAPEAEETIKYGIPTFVLCENLVHFAAFKSHIGFYPTPSAIEQFGNELASYKRAKGSVQFPLDAPMPMDLVRRIVKFRVTEVRAKSPIKKQRDRK